VVDSWISTGENLPVSPDTLEKVFGRDELHALAGQSGVAPEQATGILAQILPHVISGATPNGDLPATGQLDSSNVLNTVSQLFGPSVPDGSPRPSRWSKAADRPASAGHSLASEVDLVAVAVATPLVSHSRCRDPRTGHTAIDF
jgi:hypothetical protein